MLFLKRAAWSERETGPFLEDNGELNSFEILISGLSLLHDVETLTYTDKIHSGSSENFKSPIALNLDEKDLISGVLTLNWSSQSQKYYPLNTVDRLRDLQHNLGQRQDLCLGLYRRRFTLHFYQNQVKRHSLMFRQVQSLLRCKSHMVKYHQTFVTVKVKKLTTFTVEDLMPK